LVFPPFGAEAWVFPQSLRSTKGNPSFFYGVAGGKDPTLRYTPGSWGGGHDSIPPIEMGHEIQVTLQGRKSSLTQKVKMK
jgi:hypothetical protein